MVEELEMSKGDYESLLLVVDKIYESPFETTGWVDALDELTKFVGCMAADLYISHADAPPVMAHYGFFDDLMEEYLTHYHDQNGRVKAVQAKPTGGMVTDHDVVSRTEMSQSPFYQDFIFKYGYGLNIACAALNEPNESALFGVHYPFGVDPYTTENFRRLELVMPHISRAARLRNRLRISLDREHRLAAAIDKISLGIVLLDRKGEVVQVNAAGERLLAEARGHVDSASPSKNRATRPAPRHGAVGSHDHSAEPRRRRFGRRDIDRQPRFVTRAFHSRVPRTAPGIARGVSRRNRRSLGFALTDSLDGA
ncbi:MAG: hypothetical protein M5U09_20075 [Gammaproteobacteria bacterium]|nr:hypothetical protein [Gammaproteobacteria bacterium]